MLLQRGCNRNKLLFNQERNKWNFGVATIARGVCFVVVPAVVLKAIIGKRGASINLANSIAALRVILDYVSRCCRSEKCNVEEKLE